MNLFAKFEQTARTHPHKPAFIYFDGNTWKTLTYGNLFDQTHRFFSGLQALRSNSGQACQLTPDLTAAVMTPPSIEFFPFALALLKFGIIPIILDPAIGLKKVGQILKESQPDIFIGNTLTHLLRIIFSWGKNIIKHNMTIPSVERLTLNVQREIQNHASDMAAIIYTSGSTGLPKGAIYTHSNLAAQLELLQNTFNISQDEIDLPAFPLYALIDILLGVTSVIPDITFPIPSKTDPEKVLDAIQKFNVTNMFASPVVLDILSNYWHTRWSSAGSRDHHAQEAPKLSGLKRIITAGAPATIPLQENFRKLLDDKTDLFGIYGATESLPIAKIESRELFSLKEKTGQGAGVCLGKPINGVTVRVIRISESAIQQWQDELEVESNVVGEITVQSAATTRAYVGQIGNLTYKIKIDDDIIHCMGDVGYFDEEGRLWYCGRKSHRVLTKDGTMFTEQIENIFNAHPQVNRTALVGVDSKPVLWVELEKNEKENKDKIKNQLIDLAKHHPQASKIKVFLFMKKFPTDVRHNSKIIREKLAVMAKNYQSPITKRQ